MSMRLEIITGERVLFQGDVDVVVAPGSEGELAVLPRHAALMTMLEPGELRYKSGSEESFFTVGGGFMEVTADRVIVLADVAERVDEIDEARAQEALRRAQEQIAHRGADIDLERALQAVRRAQVRVNVARRRRRGSGSPGGRGAGEAPGG